MNTASQKMWYTKPSARVRKVPLAPPGLSRRESFGDSDDDARLRRLAKQYLA